MKTKLNEDGSTSYTLSQNEKIMIWTVVAFLYGRRTGFTKGRSTMAREIHKTGTPQP